MTHQDRINQSILKTVTREHGENRWGARHCAAWKEPQPIEEGVVTLLKGAAHYADRHAGRYGSKIGDDGVLGPAWEDILRSILTLLNGELGRLDGGTLDGLIREMLEAEGFTD